MKHRTETLWTNEEHIFVTCQLVTQVAKLLLSHSQVMVVLRKVSLLYDKSVMQTLFMTLLDPLLGRSNLI